MKKTILIVFSVFAVFLLSTCALEIGNVIGPDGGYVFYDKGNYTGGWRYIQCSSYDHAVVWNLERETIEGVIEKLRKESADWYSFPWELPTEADLRKILECFSYGLTRFSPDYYYLAVDKPSDYNEGDPYDHDTWKRVILHKNFDVKANGEIEIVPAFPEKLSVRVRAIRRF